MKAKLKELYSLELTHSLEEYYPEDPTRFAISVRLMIGINGSPGSESFDIFVCTPDWMKSQYAEERCVWGRHMLIVLEYDFALIKRTIERSIEQCTGDDWLTIARELSCLGAWEFENYRSKP